MTDPEHQADALAFDPTHLDAALDRIEATLAKITAEMKAGTHE